MIVRFASSTTRGLLSPLSSLLSPLFAPKENIWNQGNYRFIETESWMLLSFNEVDCCESVLLRLYALKNGQLVQDSSELENKEEYVAVGSERKWVPAFYYHEINLLWNVCGSCKAASTLSCPSGTCNAALSTGEIPKSDTFLSFPPPPSPPPPSSSS